MKKVLTTLLPLLFLLLLSAAPSQAQCTMCKTSVEAARSEKDAYDFSGLNKGILYIMIAPYVMGGLVAFFWYRNVQRAKKQQASAA